jgi:Methylase involved in ubiquinone/menaquinone biosynthesis
VNKRWFDLLNLHQPRLECPQGLDQQGARRFLKTVRIDGGPVAELEGYVDRDWRRFLFTWMLCRSLEGRCLEIGAAPYFTTALLSEFSSLDLTLSNYSPSDETSGEHGVRWVSPNNGSEMHHTMRHDLFNVENDCLPYPDNHFDVVLFCEVLEHLTNDPFRALGEIRRVIKPGGRLILTTPNVACAKNVLKMFKGGNVNDRYSAYGPYGRHNREFTAAEVRLVLAIMEFSVERLFTANVLFRRMSQLIANFAAVLAFTAFSRSRARALGQYILVSAVKGEASEAKRPEWLFRSYADPDQTFELR